MGWRSKHEKIGKVNVLVVGAGGIGCELLKNMVLTGFKNIHVVDLDTIDVSNLNRQFLFRREHVGQPKAKVAVEAVKAISRNVNITYSHDSIFSDHFNLNFFKQFDMVINALDNRKARNHVNRMCLATRIPLIESGSAGYLGQVSVIIREKTECYECVDKPSAQKTFPGCTIRNTPSEHIHCTVWSKHLFNQLFGEIDIDDDVSPDMNDKDGKEDTENTDNTKKDSEIEPSQINTRQWAENVKYDCVQLFDKLFNVDIQYLCSMDHLWKQRKRPIPLTYQKSIENGEKRNVNEVLDDVNKVWTLEECVNVFSECIKKLRDRKASLPESEILVWDKDDSDAMAFVAACANIRAKIFNIPSKSMFEIKAMAGNIIPAIATTNAIVAGMMITEAIKLVHEEYDKIANVFIAGKPNQRGKILSDEPPQKPNPKCYVCSEKRECFVVLNPAEMTIKGFNDKVLKNGLNMISPDVMEISNQRIIISSEGDTDDLDCKKLSELSISDGVILECDDFSQDLNLTIFIRTKEALKGDDFEIVRGLEKEDHEENSRKRKPSESENGEIVPKKIRVDA